MRLFKVSFTKQVLESNSERSLKHRIADFLLRCRSTHHGTTAELLMKRQLRKGLNLVKLAVTKLVNKKQEFQKVQFDRTRNGGRMFDVGDVVKVKNKRAQSRTNKWLFSSITEVNDSLVDNTATSVNSEQNSLFIDQDVDNVNNRNDTSKLDRILVKKKTFSHGFEKIKQGKKTSKEIN